MNVLSLEKRVNVIAHLVEGNSIASTSRLTTVHPDTIGRLLLRIGAGCDVIHNRFFQGLHANIIQLDELWSFVGKKQKNLTDNDNHQLVGDQWVYLAMDSHKKGIISYTVGKRTLGTTELFLNDLKMRVINKPTILTDGYIHYVDMIEQSFGDDVNYAQLIKENVGTHRPTILTKRVITGHVPQSEINTSYIERLNLTVRMSGRRFTRKTNAFSRKLHFHMADVSLHVAWYNFCRIHETLKCTPAMEMGVTSTVWSIRDLVEFSLEAACEGEYVDHTYLSRVNPVFPTLEERLLPTAHSHLRIVS